MIPDNNSIKKVLIVDDETDMMIFLSTLMESHGFTPVVAGNGRDGLQKALDEPPDCIILNGMMADEDGVSMYIMLKKDSQLRNIPVIILSAIPSKAFFHYQKFQNIHPAKKIPEPDAYLENPPDTEELIRLVRELSGGSEKWEMRNEK